MNNFSIYNIKNHKLDGEKFRKLNEFSTDNFAGKISNETSVITIENDTWKWTTQKDLNFIGGGCYINLDEDTTTYDLDINEMSVISVSLDANGNITNDFSSATHIQEIVVSNLEVTTITTSSSSETITRPYCKFTYNSKDYVYTDNSIWISDTQFFIPICVNDNGVLKQLIANRDKSSLESFLSVTSYNELLKYLNNSFVYRTGSTGENNYRGNIGQLNITDHTVSKRNVESDSDVYENVNDSINLDFTNIYLNEENPTNISGIYKDNTNKVISDGPVPIEAGGTNATNRNGAKIQLGIYVGTTDPNVSSPITNPQTNDIYLRIVDTADM